jgi:tripartite ATP-independent transporter DctP family solute receptor
MCHVRWLSLGLAALALLLPGTRPATAQTVLKFATTVGPGNPVNEAAAEFAKVAAERSKGQLKVEVYINNQLARGEAAMLEGVQLGTIELAAIGSAPIGGMFEPLYQALDLPFLWTTRAQVWKVMDGPIGQDLLKKMEARGVKGLCFGGGWGFRNMMSNKRPIFTPDDMKGQTIRVQESPTYIALMKALGANPVPMPWGEVYLAMKQGTVDGMELPSFSLVSDKFHEVTKFYSLTRHSYPPIAYFVTLRTWDGLSPDLRRAVDDAARAACAFHRTIEVAKETTDLEFMRKAGVKINEVRDLKAFRDRVGPVYEAVTAKVGKEFLDRLTAAARAAQ